MELGKAEKETTVAYLEDLPQHFIRRIEGSHETLL
jgi:hypothetical protein